MRIALFFAFLLSLLVESSAFSSDWPDKYKRLMNGETTSLVSWDSSDAVLHKFMNQGLNCLYYGNLTVLDTLNYMASGGFDGIHKFSISKEKTHNGFIIKLNDQYLDKKGSNLPLNRGVSHVVYTYEVNPSSFPYLNTVGFMRNGRTRQKGWIGYQDIYSRMERMGPSLECSTLKKIRSSAH